VIDDLLVSLNQHDDQFSRGDHLGHVHRDR
jgi:hypothetical protein